MHVTCPKCANRIAAKNIDLTQLLAKCSHCDTLTSIAHFVERTGSNPPRPDGVDIISRDDLLHVSWGWRGWYVVPTLLMAVFWNGVMGTMGLAAIFSGERLALAIFLLPHFWVGIAFGYKALADLFNHTTVEVAEKKLSIRVSPFPFPWNGSKQFATKDFTQFFVKEESTWGRLSNKRRQTLYALYGIDRANNLVKIMVDISSAELALYIESQLETFFGIVDIPVRGEIPRAVAR